MNDTSPKIEEKLAEMFSKKTSEERFLMGCSMHDSSKKMVIESIRQNQPDISDTELKKQVFLRFYGEDFTSEETAHLLNYLSSSK